MSLVIGLAVVVALNIFVIIRLALLLDKRLKMLHRKINLVHHHLDIRGEIYQNISDDFIKAARAGNKTKAVELHQAQCACPISRSLDIYWEIREDMQKIYG